MKKFIKRYHNFLRGNEKAKSFCNVTQKILARGSTNLGKLVQRNFKQNMMLSNESGVK